MQFFTATQTHYPEIAKLVSSPEELYLVFPNGKYPWDESQLMLLAKSRSDFTIAVVDDEIIAFANLYNVNFSGSAFIGNVIVSDKHKGKGVGKALTNHMMSLCQIKYKAVAHLSVFTFNTKAARMYEHLGFKGYATEERQNLTGEPVTLMHMRYERKA